MKRWQIVVGLGLILWGGLALAEVFFNINLWRFVAPMILIGLGLLLILRQRNMKDGVPLSVRVFGDIDKHGSWAVTDQEIWVFVGTNRFDFSTANFPSGDVTIKIFGFVSDVKIILPADLGFQIVSMAFVSDFKGLGGGGEHFITPLEFQSPNYEGADRRVNLQIAAFVSEIEVQSSFS